MGDTEAPGLDDVIREFIDAGLAQLHAAIPAVVVVYDPVLQRASCQPVLRKRIRNPATGGLIPSPTPSPPTPPLPVQWPSGAAGAWAITGPLLPGDPVTLLVRSRSCDEYQSTGLPDNVPLDPRKWAIQDAVVLPGARPNVPPLSPLAYDPLSMVIYGTPAGPLKLGSNLAVDSVLRGTSFLTALSSYLSAVSLATSVVGTAPQNAAALGAIKVATDALLTAIGTPATSPLASTSVKVAP